MKIAHIVCTYPPYYGGMGNLTFQTAQALIARGHEVTVFTPGYYDRKEIKPREETPEKIHAEDLETQGATVKRIAPKLQYGNAAYLSNIARELDDFDIVHLHYPFYGTANIVKKWKEKNPDKRLVITYHMDPRAYGWKGVIFSLYAKFWMPKILRVADAICVSSFDYAAASAAADMLNTEHDKWYELPFGVDIERFSPREKSASLLEKHKIDTDTPVVLFVGGMDEAHYFKGVDILLKSLVVLKQKELKIKVILVGDGPLKEKFMLTANGLGVSHMVEFAGYVSEDDLPSYYNLADVFVLPSINRGEAFGMVLLEAFASGVPVIASDLAGVRTVANQAGMTISPRDPYALADAISGFFSPENDREAWKKLARERAETVYAWPEIAGKLEDIYTLITKNVL
ncbi:MAG: glycosyltransferase family 4 protein [Candidatus Magasanikbacteria bacterium]|nr:glycosyltransferase family 4 protein [Candidatus Magasanikbacteria bacterium]MBT4071322.1 glycosyltransferase family 4 protein [Candidatus Magasanikbacteria bacterium]